MGDFEFKCIEQYLDKEITDREQQLKACKKLIKKLTDEKDQLNAEQVAFKKYRFEQKHGSLQNCNDEYIQQVLNYCTEMSNPDHDMCCTGYDVWVPHERVRTSIYFINPLYYNDCLPSDVQKHAFELEFGKLVIPTQPRNQTTSTISEWCYKVW